MTQLQINLLGPPEIALDGRPLSFPARKALALLIYLVVKGGAQPRDTLAALFWPESGAGRARATLRNSLYRLRTVLGADNYLLADQETLAFNFEAAHHLDLARVQAVLEQPPAQVSISRLQEAASLYRGYFLEGFTVSGAPEFDNWTTVQGEKWHHRRDVLFDRLSRRQFEAGHWHAARDSADRWLTYSPLSEKAYRRLMRVLLAAGDRAGALQAYERCCQILAAELAVPPAPKTQALAEHIRQNEVTPARQRTDSPTQPRFVNGPLVGRSIPFQQLTAAFNQAAAGRPRLLTIHGEAGIGKTRLATEFLQWAAAQGADVLQGRCFAGSQPIPYQPWIAALRTRIEQLNAPEDWLADVWLTELSSLLPELRERYPDLVPARREEATARSRLFEAVTRLTLALAAEKPLVLFVDDLQWADTASLDLLQYAASRWREHQAPLLLLCAHRDQAGRAPDLVDSLAALNRELAGQAISLAPLTAEDMVHFMDAFGADEESDLAEWLYAQTSGQPFYLVETLADLWEQGVISAVYQDESWQISTAAVSAGGQRPEAQVPEKVQQLIAARLHRLSAEARNLLAAAAVVGHEFPFEELYPIAGLAENAALPALEELLQSGLLREISAQWVATYELSHDNIREVAYREMSSARQRIFHGRALDRLDEMAAPPARLAGHALAAGRPDAAFQYSLQAGSDALSLFAAREAITHLEQARSILQQLPASNQQLRELFLPLGRAYELAGDFDAALASYDALQALARERDDSPLELAALMARTTIYAAPTQHYDPDNVAVLTREALPLARELADHRAESKILWNLMLLRLFNGELEEAVAAGEESLAIARAHNLPERMAYALHDLTRAYLFTGQAEKGLAAGQEARGLWRQLDNKAMLADNLISTSSARFFWQAADEQILQQLKEALALSLEIENLWNQSYANHILGTVYFDLGRFGEAIEACKQAIALGREAGFMVPVFLNGSLLAIIYGMAGRADLGLPWVQAGLAEGTEMGDQHAGLLAARAFLHLCQGDLDAAETSIRQSYELMDPRSLLASIFLTLPIGGRVRLARGEYQQTLDGVQQLFDYLQQSGLRLFRADAFYLQGRALLALGQTDEAQAALWEAEEIARAANSRRILWEILAALAQAAQEQGEKQAAESLHDQANELLEELAASFNDTSLQQSFLEKNR